MTDPRIVTASGSMKTSRRGGLRPARCDIHRPEVSAPTAGIDRAARKRGKPSITFFCSGPPASGKTTLAYVIGRNSEAVRATVGPVLERRRSRSDQRASESARCSSSRIHRCTGDEEILYPRWRITADIVIGQAPERDRSKASPEIHADGATTRRAC